MNFSNSKKIVSILLAVMLFFSSFGLISCGNEEATDTFSEEIVYSDPGDEPIEESTVDPASITIDIGIAWREDTDAALCSSMTEALMAVGLQPVLLNQVIDDDLEYTTSNKIARSGQTNEGALSNDYASIIKMRSYKNSNVEQVLQNVRAIIFTGGENISPSLHKKSEKFSGDPDTADFNATRDVSDYLLMSYCIDHDIPTIGFGRGMDLLAVISGAEMIQHIPTYCQAQGVLYNDAHGLKNLKEPESQNYAAHSLTLSDQNTILYDMLKKEVLNGVPSLHDEAIKTVDNTKLKVTGTVNTNGFTWIEGIERTDLSMVMGIGFHPEISYSKNVSGSLDAMNFMTEDEVLSIFNYLYAYVTREPEEME